MASISLSSVFQKRKSRSAAISMRRSSTSEIAPAQAVRNNVKRSTRMSFTEQVAARSDTVLKGLNLAALQSEEIDEESSDEADGKTEYVEVGVTELYRHRLSECIFAARRSSEVCVAEEMARRNSNLSFAHKHPVRQRRRDSLQSLASIERRLSKNRIGRGSAQAPTTAKPVHKKNHRRAVRRDSMKSLASIENQLIKNQLAAPTHSQDSKNTSATFNDADLLVAVRQKRKSDVSIVSALGFDFTPNSSSSSSEDWSY